MANLDGSSILSVKPVEFASSEERGEELMVVLVVK